MQIKSDFIQVSFNKNGSVKSLSCVNHPDINWILPDSETFGIPFVNGNQTNERYLNGISTIQQNSATFVSESGKTKVKFTLNDDLLSFTSCLPLYVGPRSGIDFSFNLLDSPGDDWQNQCMPHVFYTAKDQNYCYIIFYNPQGGYLTLVLDHTFAAWRIKYSQNGHKMVGFHVLNEIDDLVGKSLPLSRKLTGHLFFSKDLSSAYDKLSDILQTTLISYQQSGVPVGNKLPLTIHGDDYSDSYQVISPSGNVLELSSLHEVSLFEVGTHTLRGISSGRTHQTKVMAHASWSELLKQSSEFYQTNFQDETGAFYRIIWSDTLSPKDGVTYEGIAFGDPQKMISCKTGEFGGFAGWLMIKESLANPEDLKARVVAQKYIESWALNLDHPETPLPGTITAFPQEFGGRTFGPYHVYHDFNYPQYEIFLLEELVDYFRLTEKPIIRDMAIKIGHHFAKEHIHAEGYVWCKNKATSVPRDYSTVHTPVTGLYKLAMISSESDKIYFLEKAEKLADHICHRGLNFPTEGEQSTEDGSMACSALSLLYAYKYIAAKPEYLDMAKLILDKHRVLELNGTDSRLFFSSLRFWETMYETRDWGPSINGGHAWSLWTAEAKLLYAEITGNYQALKEAYSGFIATLSNIDSNGGIYCCYTPDMIPGKPHTYDLYLEDSIKKGNFLDLFETSTKFAQSQPKGSYSTSGIYTLIKSQEYWTRLAGIDFDNATVINGLLSSSSLSLSIENQGSLFINGLPKNKVVILVPKTTQRLNLRITPKQIESLEIEGCKTNPSKTGLILCDIHRSFSIKQKRCDC